MQAPHGQGSPAGGGCRCDPPWLEDPAATGWQVQELLLQVQGRIVCSLLRALQVRETAVWSAQGQCRAVVSGAREDSAGTAGWLVVPGKVCSTACSTDSWSPPGVAAGVSILCRFWW